MKSNLTKTLLDWALATSVLLGVIFFAQYFVKSRAFRSESGPMQQELLRVQANRAVLNALLGESVEYSKKNPAFKPVLESIGITQTNAAAAPQAKPSTP